MTPATSPEKQRPAVSTLLAGVLGGLVVLVLGAVLIATDVIDTGDDRTVVRESTLTPPSSDPGSTDGGRTVNEIYRQEGRGVVFVEAQGVAGSSIFGQDEGAATGSGFVVDEDGTILTNAHVVDGADEVTVSFEEGSDAIDAELRGVDVDTDLAVLKIDPDEVEDLRVIPLGDSSKAQVGDPVVAIGNPFGLERTVTTGIVSALQRQIDAPSGFAITDVIQTDASINPGNSGGPLLDAQGRAIGINSQIATGGGGGSVGIGFAVPVNTAKELLPELKRGEDPEQAYLGVSMADVTEDLATELDLTVDEGALVQEVTPGGPADDAGLEAGEDVIVAIDGEPADSAEDVVNAVAGKRPGDTVELEVRRGDDTRTVRVELEERPDQLGQTPDESPLFPIP
jgi:S1-C subfamily serine protease